MNTDPKKTGWARVAWKRTNAVAKGLLEAKVARVGCRGALCVHVHA